MPDSMDASVESEQRLEANVSAPIEILYQDDCLVAINKPEGLLVHRSPIDKHETRFALQETRNQIGRHVYPIHRLDKPTSGVLLFALSPEVATRIQSQFHDQTVQKNYLLVCRGYTPFSGEIDHPLVPRNDFKKKKKPVEPVASKPAQDAVTRFERLATLEIEAQVDRYPVSRYSLVKASPVTGRKHQIRRHFKHISHPIVGCPKYGKSNHNRYFADMLRCPRLLLHCQSMEFVHPVTQKRVKVAAPLSGCFASLMDQLWVFDGSDRE